MKEIKRVFVESKQYGVEEIQFKNWKSIRVYLDYPGYKKQAAIEVKRRRFLFGWSQGCRNRQGN